MRALWNEEVVHRAVVDGELVIDAEGRVWRTGARRADRWTGSTRLIQCLPRRAERRLPLGYLQVRVMWDHERTHALAHRLVWFHLYGHIPEGLTVNHKDGDGGCNRPSNLELATGSEQIEHSWRVLGRRCQDGTANHQAKLTEAAVVEIRERRNAGERLRVLAADFQVSDRTISKIVRGERWRFLG